MNAIQNSSTFLLPWKRSRVLLLRIIHGFVTHSRFRVLIFRLIEVVPAQSNLHPDGTVLLERPSFCRFLSSVHKYLSNPPEYWYHGPQDPHAEKPSKLFALHSLEIQTAPDLRQEVVTCLLNQQRSTGLEYGTIPPFPHQQLSTSLLHQDSQRGF